MAVLRLRTTSRNLMWTISPAEIMIWIRSGCDIFLQIQKIHFYFDAIKQELFQVFDKDAFALYLLKSVSRGR